MVVRKAWMDPQGTIIDIPPGQHHINTLPPEVPWNDSTKLGWIRLTVRDVTLDIEGYPERIEYEKQNILAWAGPRVKWVNIDPQGAVPIETSSETLEEENINRLLWRARMTGATVFRRHPRPIRRAEVAVRRHLRHPPGMCLCHRSQTVDRMRRKIVRRLN